MAMTEKSAYQKLYEKFRMAELAEAGEIRVMCARQNGTPGVYLVIGDTPIAKLLTKRVLDETVPDFPASEKIMERFEEMKSIDPRTRSNSRWLKEFDELVGDGFEEEFLRSVDDLPEGGE